MNDAKKADLVFDPKSSAFRYKLWLHANTPAGPRLFILWRRVIILIVILLFLAWLGTAGALWAFVKYQRGVADVSFIDIAFYPVRRAHYRASLARHHLTVAKQQLEKSDWSGGLLSLRVAHGHDPRDLEIRSLLAEVYLMFRRPELARQLLEQGVPYAKDDVDYLSRTFGVLRSQRQFDRIVSLGATLLPATPDETRSHRMVALQMAIACLELKRYDEAEAIITRWTLDRTTEGQIILADLAVARGAPELALKRLQDQLERTPQNELLSIHLTKLYFKFGRLDEARRVALMRTFFRPESPGAHIDLLNILIKSGTTDEFHREFTRYIGNFTADPKALILLAALTADQARPDLSQQVLDTARGAGHETSPFLIALMRAQCASKHYADALQTAKELEQLPTSNARALALLLALKTWAFFGLNNDAEGEATLQRYLTERQLNPLDALRLAAALGELGKDQVQGRVLTALVNLQPAPDDAIIALATYHAQRNAWAEAGALLPQLRTVAAPPDELIQTIQWHLDSEASSSTHP